MPGFIAKRSKNSQASNWLKNFVVPNLMLRGTISFSWSFQEYPRVTLSFNSLDRKNFNSVRARYALNREFSFGGIKYLVSQSGISKEEFFIEDDTYRRYDFQVDGEYFYQNRIEEEIDLKKFSGDRREITVGELASLAKVPFSGSSIAIPLPEKIEERPTLSLRSILDEVAAIEGGWVEYGATVKIKKGRRSHEVIWMTSDDYPTETTGSAPYYDGVELTWGQANEEDLNESRDTGATIQLKEPATDTTVNEDDNFDLPPIDSIVLRSLDSNHHMGGETKKRTIDKAVDGKPISQEIFIKGFAYSARDIALEDEQLFSDNPAQFWRLVEYQKQEYIYEKVAGINLSAKAVNPETKEELTLIIDPDYESLMSLSLGGGDINIRTPVRYLTKILITGWKYIPLAKEDPNTDFYSLLYAPDTDDPEELSILEALKFRTVPLTGRTEYLLKSTRAAYRNKELSNPFSVQWYDLDTLPTRFNNKVPKSAIASNKQIGVLTLNESNYVEPYYVAEERNYKNSFAWMPYPIEEDPPKPPLMAGEITDDRISRTIKGGRVQELTTNFSSSDSGFLDSQREGKLRKYSGEPPQADYLSQAWEKKERDRPKIPDSSNPEKKNRYLLHSKKGGTLSKKIGGSLNFNLATTLERALTAARTNLWHQTLSATKTTRSLAWYYPKIAPGDLISASFESTGTWMVQDISYSLSVSGDAEQDIVQCAGTEVSCCVDVPVTISYRTVPNSEDSNASENDSPNFDIVVGGGASRATLGDIDLNTPSRRKF